MLYTALSCRENEMRKFYPYLVDIELSFGDETFLRGEDL